MTFTLKSDNSSTLTCISTGGPATTVTWTRDSTTVTMGNKTMLNDPVTAKYTYTLLVTDKMAGLYTCTVANKVSFATAGRIVQGQTEQSLFKNNKKLHL